MQAFYTPKIALSGLPCWDNPSWWFPTSGYPKRICLQVPNKCFNSLWPSHIRSLRFLEIFKPPTHLLPNLHNQHWRRHSLFHPNEAHASAESTREMRSKSVPVFIICTQKNSEKEDDTRILAIESQWITFFPYFSHTRWHISINKYVALTVL